MHKMHVQAIDLQLEMIEARLQPSLLFWPTVLVLPVGQELLAAICKPVRACLGNMSMSSLHHGAAAVISCCRRHLCSCNARLKQSGQESKPVAAHALCVPRPRTAQFVAGLVPA